MEKLPLDTPVSTEIELFDQEKYNQILKLLSSSNTDEMSMGPEFEKELEEYLKELLKKQDESIVLPILATCHDKYVAAEISNMYLKEFAHVDFLHMSYEEREPYFEKPRHFLKQILQKNLVESEDGWQTTNTQVLDFVRANFPKELLWNDEELIRLPQIEKFLKNSMLDSIENYRKDTTLYGLYVETYSKDNSVGESLNEALKMRYRGILKTDNIVEHLKNAEKVAQELGIEIDQEKLLNEALEETLIENTRLSNWSTIEDLVRTLDAEGLIPKEKSIVQLKECILQEKSDITQYIVRGFCRVAGIDHETKDVFEHPASKELATSAALRILSKGSDPRDNGFPNFPIDTPGIEAALKSAIRIDFDTYNNPLYTVKKFVEQYADRHESVMNDPELQTIFQTWISKNMYSALSAPKEFQWLYMRTNISPETLKEMGLQYAKESFMKGDTYFFDGIEDVIPFTSYEREQFLATVGVAAQKNFIEQKQYKAVGKFARRYEQLQPLYYQQVAEFMKIIHDQNAPAQQRLQTFLIDLPTMAEEIGDEEQLKQLYKDQPLPFIALSLEYYDTLDEALKEEAYSFLEIVVHRMDKDMVESFLTLSLRERPDDTREQYFHDLIARALELKVDLTSIIEMMAHEQLVKFESNRSIENQCDRRSALVQSFEKILHLPNLETFLHEIVGNTSESHAPETITKFLEQYTIGPSKKGYTIAMLELLKIAESKEVDTLGEVLERLSEKLQSYEKILNTYTSEAIPEGLHVSIGMEYEISYKTAGRFLEKVGSSLSDEIGAIAAAARVGRGNDGVFEVATHPTDNPYMLMLEMKLLSDLGYIDFNFTPDTIHEQSARGCHISMGGEGFRGNLSSHMYMVQNMLVLSGWAGVPGGKEEVSGGNISEHGYSDRTQLFNESTHNTIYEFRGLSLDKTESFERTIQFLHTAGIGINAFREILPKYDGYNFDGFLDRIDTTSPDTLFATLKRENTVDSEIDGTTKQIAYHYLKLSKNLMRTVEQHNEQFLTQETVGYFDKDDVFVDAESGTTVAKRFKQYLAENDESSKSLEVYMQQQLTITPYQMVTGSGQIYSTANRLSNMYLKYRHGERSGKEYSLNTSANTAAFLSETKIGNALEFPDTIVGNQKDKSVFDEDHVDRKGYYYIQDATPEMLIHKVQQLMLEYQESMRELLVVKKMQSEII